MFELLMYAVMGLVWGLIVTVMGSIYKSPFLGVLGIMFFALGTTAMLSI